MKKVYLGKIYSLENYENFQIFNLINTIIMAYKKKKNIIIIDKFLNDKNDTFLHSNISDIINLDKFNKFLIKNYNLSIFDRENLDYKVHTIKYGHFNNNIDITNEILSQFSIPNNLLVNTNVNLNYLKNYDPIPNVQKHVYIHYSINNVNFKEIYDEYAGFLKNPIIFNLDDNNFKYNPINLSNLTDKNMFDNILENLCFAEIYDIIANNYIETHNLFNTKINIIDLQMNNYKNEDIEKIENKYISLILKYIDKNDNIIILPSLSNINNDNILKFLKNNEYKYFIHTYLPILGTEINYIIDLNIGKHCNNIYIGNFDMNKLSGSNFTYILLQQMHHNVKHVLFDIDNIDSPEQINF
jgi:hypothetical protein